MNIDSENMIEVLRRFPDMITESLTLGEDISLPKELVENIIVCGMGGSGYNGDLLKVYLNELPIQIHVVKDYIIPKFANRKSLIFTASYSGNTEETVAAYRMAIKRGCKVISISSGGKLLELSQMNKNSHILVPKGIQPRLSTPYQFIAMLNVLQNCKIIEKQNERLEKCAYDLSEFSKKIEENAKDLASKVKGRVPIIYSSQKMFCIAEKWKTDINENAKTHAFYNSFSEFNHNEICSYENPVGDFYVIIVSDMADHPRIQKRVKIFKKLLREYNTPLTEISITGDNFLTRLISSVWMGLFLAYYLALEYNIDPSPVIIIEKLKKDLVK